jgi:hypothetical protein
MGRIANVTSRPETARVSDFEELASVEERPTAHPGDLGQTVLPEVRRLFTAGDFETVLPMAEALLASTADDEVHAIVMSAREKLADFYAAKLGRLAKVPILEVPASEWMSLDLDHRACFLLVHVDNVSSFEMILDTSGMPRHEAMRLLCDLLERGIIGR